MPARALYSPPRISRVTFGLPAVLEWKPHEARKSSAGACVTGGWCVEESSRAASTGETGEWPQPCGRAWKGDPSRVLGKASCFPEREWRQRAQTAEPAVELLGLHLRRGVRQALLPTILWSEPRAYLSPESGALLSSPCLAAMSLLFWISLTIKMSPFSWDVVS